MAIPVGTAVGYLDLDYSSFTKKLDTAITEANGLSTKFADTIGSGLTTIGDKISSVGTRLTTSISVPLGLAMASAVKFGAEFDKGMSNVKAVSGATAEEFQIMRDAAIDWGEKTVFTAKEASDALYYMGLAGWDAGDSVKALGPVLNLAAAGNLELGRTSDIVTDAMTALGLEADKTTHGIANAEYFTNALAAAMSNSNTDVDQLGEAFKYVAPVAGSLGYSIEDLSLALGTMANVGVKGSQAGTGLRQALKNLITPANDAAAALMDELGISLFDAEGNALSFKEVMDNLRTTFDGVDVDIEKMSDVLENEGEDALLNYVDGLNLTMTQQEKLQNIVKIFGTRALPGVLAIINATDDKFNNLADSIYGSDKAFVQHGNDIMTYKEAVEQFGEELVNTSGEFQVLGAAEGMAMIQMDNLQGDWIKFTSALGTAKIEITDLVKGALREFVQRLTDLVKWFNGLDDEQQKHILKIAAIIAATGPLLLVFGKTITGIGNLIKAFSTIGGAMTKLKVGFGMLKTSISKIGGAFNLARLGATGLAEGMSPLGAALGSITAPMVALTALVVGLIASFVHLMKTNEEFRDRIMGIWDGITSKFDEAGQKILGVINKLGFDFKSLGDAIKGAFDFVSNLLAPLFIGAFQTISDAISSLIDIFTGVFEIIGGIIIGFRDGDWSTFVQGIVDFGTGLLDLLTLPFRAVFNVFNEILLAFGTSWSEIWNGIKDFFVGIWNGIRDFFTGIWDGIINAIVERFTAIVQWQADVRETVGTFFKNIWDTITGFFGTIVDGLASFFTGLFDGIGSFVSNVISKISDFVKGIIDRVTKMKDDVVDKFNTLKSKVEKTVTDLKDNVVSKFNDLKTKVINKVVEIKNGFINKFNEMKTKVVEIVTNVRDSIINVFSNIKETFMTIGSNIVDGIWEGISAGWNWLTDKVKGLAQSLFDAAKSALGISSPSKVFRDGIGHWIPPGIALGVEDTMPDAVKDIQGTIDDGLSQVTGEVSIDTSLVSMLDVAQQAINDVALWFETTEERLNKLVSNMRDDLLDLISVSDLLVTPDGIVIDVNKEKPSDTLKPIGENGEVTGKGSVTNNYYYTFNSPKAIDEIEASRQFKNTQRDLSEGF